MGAWSTAQALVFIAKALINLILYMQGLIKKEQYEDRCKDMSDAIYKATTGDLPGRLEAGKDIEDQINRRVKP